MSAHRAPGALLVILGALALWLAWRGHRDHTVVVQLGMAEYRFERATQPRLYAIGLALYAVVGCVLCTLGVLVWLGLIASGNRT